MLGSLNRRQSKKVREGNEKIFQTSLVSIEKNMAKTPELIYDGPFSDQMINRKPLGLEGDEVSKKEGERIAREFFGADRVQEITAFEEGKDI
ncbi:MAG: germination protein YpeB, partial [Tissierellia bacterium]|nr:germination protein YpeB [Tissierellia bacterium]